MGRSRDEAAEEYYYPSSNNSDRERQRVVALIEQDLKTKSVAEVLYDLVQNRGYRYK